MMNRIRFLLVCARTHARARARSVCCVRRAVTRAHGNAHVCTYISTSRAHTRARARTHTHTHRAMSFFACALRLREHTEMHTRVHTHTHTHTHTHGAQRLDYEVNRFNKIVTFYSFAALQVCVNGLGLNRKTV